MNAATDSSRRQTEAKQGGGSKKRHAKPHWAQAPSREFVQLALFAWLASGPPPQFFSMSFASSASCSAAVTPW